MGEKVEILNTHHENGLSLLLAFLSRVSREEYELAISFDQW